MLLALLEHVQCAHPIGSWSDDEPWSQHDLGEPGDAFLPIHGARRVQLEANELHMRGAGDRAEREEKAGLDRGEPQMLGTPGVPGPSKSAGGAVRRSGIPGVDSTA